MSGDSRPATPIRLVVSDIDGTLVNKAKLLTPRARDAIAALARKGVGFTVTSARPPVGLHAMIETLGLRVPVAAVNGGALVSPDFTVTAQKWLDPAAARRAVALLREQGLDPWLFTEDAWYARDPRGAHFDHEAMTIAQAATLVEAFDENLYERTLKVVGASHDHALLAECETLLQRELGPKALATRSQAYYLDVTNPQAHKGEAVASLSRALSIPVAAIMTIGDGINDIPMLEVAGFSVAMGNGNALVKAAARAVTDDCENEGFAKAIERFVLT